MRSKQLHRILIFVNMLILTLSLTAQTKSTLPFPDPPPNPNIFWLKCVNLHTYTTKQRLHFYPFNKASSVKLISFKNNLESSNEKSKIYEVVTLNNLQKANLTDILYNYTFRGKKYEEETNCYVPRNAIIFCDDQNVEFERIELCFECSQYKKSSDKMIIGDFCVGKYELLKNLFRKVGVKYGVLP